jgi:hypothetical protein
MAARWEQRVDWHEHEAGHEECSGCWRGLKVRGPVAGVLLSSARGPLFTLVFTVAFGMNGHAYIVRNNQRQ